MYSKMKNNWMINVLKFLLVPGKVTFRGIKGIPLTQTRSVVGGVVAARHNKFVF